MIIPQSYIDDPLMPDLPSRLYGGLPAALRPKTEATIFKHRPVVVGKDKLDCWKFGLHRYLNKRYQLQVTQITKEDYTNLHQLEWRLGTNIYADIGGMCPLTLNHTPQLNRYLYLSFLYRTEKVDKDGVWTALKDLCGYLKEGCLKPCQQPEIIYCRIQNVTHDESLKFLRLLEYRPSKITNKDLIKKYKKHLNVYRCQHRDIEEDPYWVIDPKLYRPPGFVWPRNSLSEGFGRL